MSFGTPSSPPPSPNYCLDDGKTFMACTIPQPLAEQAKPLGDALAKRIFGPRGANAVSIPRMSAEELCYFRIGNDEWSFNPLEGAEAWYYYPGIGASQRISMHCWSKSTTDMSQYLSVRLETLQAKPSDHMQRFTVLEFGFVMIVGHGLYYRIGTGDGPKGYEYPSFEDLAKENHARQIMFVDLSVFVKRGTDGKSLY